MEIFTVLLAEEENVGLVAVAATDDDENNNTGARTNGNRNKTPTTPTLLRTVQSCATQQRLHTVDRNGSELKYR